MKKISGLCAGAVALLVLPTAQAQVQVQDAPSSAVSAASAMSATSSRPAREAAFLAVLPHKFDLLDTLNDGAKKAETAHIISRNPGKDDAIRAIVAWKTDCETKIVHATDERLFQELAHALPDDTLSRLTVFYSSDYRRFDEIENKTSPTQAEQAEAGEILARYKNPVNELLSESDKAMHDVASDPASCLPGFGESL